MRNSYFLVICDFAVMRFEFGKCGMAVVKHIGTFVIRSSQEQDTKTYNLKILSTA